MNCLLIGATFPDLGEHLGLIETAVGLLFMAFVALGWRWIAAVENRFGKIWGDGGLSERVVKVEEEQKHIIASVTEILCTMKESRRAEERFHRFVYRRLGAPAMADEDHSVDVSCEDEDDTADDRKGGHGDDD